MIRRTVLGLAAGAVLLLGACTPLAQATPPAVAPPPAGPAPATPAPPAPPVDQQIERWVGEYTYTESAPSGPGSPQLVTQRLTVFAEGDRLLADYDAHGFQTNRRVRAEAIASGDTLELRFVEFREESKLTDYEPGELLLTLVERDGALLTDWAAVTPIIFADYQDPAVAFARSAPAPETPLPDTDGVTPGDAGARLQVDGADVAVVAACQMNGVSALLVDDQGRKFTIRELFTPGINGPAEMQAEDVARDQDGTAGEVSAETTYRATVTMPDGRALDVAATVDLVQMRHCPGA